MKVKILITVVAAVMNIAALQAQAPFAWGDQGNDTYKNPVLNADYSDPDVIRVGDSYYMVASDFHFMGMQVLKSSDLVNWQVVSQVFDRLDYPGWDSNAHYGGGSWAPAIRFHDGLFYVYFCTPDEGLFMSTASNASGPWSPLHCVKQVEKWEDPCPFWDGDGQAYLGRSQYGAGPIIIHRMSADGKQLLDDGVTVYTGPVAEGTKIMKRDGYYYLVIPEGGVCCGWQTVLRSRSIYGPYEKRVVLEQGSTDVNGPHQGALVDTPDGTWWFLHFQETHPRGRVVHMQPARWHDGWPLIGVDIDGNGIGEPVAVWTSPMAEASPCTTVFSGDFTSDTLYWAGQHRRPLAPQWQWCHNPVDSAWSMGERKGYLTLHALPADSLKACRNMLTQKTVGYSSEATTTIDCSQLKEGDHAGLLCMGKRFMAVGVCRQMGRNYYYVEDGGRFTVLSPCRRSTVSLRVSIDSENNAHQFYTSDDGRHFTPAGLPFSLRMGYWKGSRTGLYCYNREGTPGGKAMFRNFNYDIKK
ncbi:MAG: glycoside hydrolase 43 family protein [Prevotella sp.]|nr:glycoside hydrolase 43 family protein [Prevotella sp.]